MNRTTSQPVRRVSLMMLIIGAMVLPAWGQFDPNDQSIHEVYRLNQIVEHLNDELPLELQFTDSLGQPVKLGELFDGQRPVLLALVYFRCPMLCGMITQATLAGVKELAWTPGQEYRVVIVSFDHNEKPELAELNRRAFLADLNRPGADKGVHFLTGSQANIKALAGAIGFPFQWSEETSQYTHPAAIYAITPVGRISRYLHGVDYPEKNLRLSLVEASAGRVGSFADRVVLLCSHFDADRRGYVTSAMRLMNFSAATLGAGLLGVVFAWIIYRKMSRRSAKRSTSNMASSVNA